MTTGRGVVAAAAVPAAAYLLDELGRVDQAVAVQAGAAPLAEQSAPTRERAEAVVALRGAIADLFADQPRTDLVVVVAPGPSAVHARVDLTLAPWGRPGPDPVDVADAALLARVAAAVGARVDADAPLRPEHVVLLRLLRDAVGALPAVVAISIDPTSSAAVLRGTGAELAAALTAHANASERSRRALVLVPGDLAATRDTSAPGYLVEGAVDVDHAITEAVSAGDVDALAAVGPVRAAEVMARGWAPLVLMHGMFEPFAPDETWAACVREVSAVRGVGQLLATWTRSTSSPSPAASEPTAGPRSS